MLSKEIWVKVKGFECFYEVSNLGRVKSLDREIVYCNGRKDKFKGKIKKFSKNNFGYLHVTLFKNSKSLTTLVHRLVAKHFIPNPENKPQINHIDNNPANNNVSNLEWVTQQENRNHCVNQSRQKGASKGSKHHFAILSEKDVLAIRKEYKETKISQIKLSNKYNVSDGCIYAIVHRKSWNHI